jgi:Holliday junction resolvase-like predicted endonuclease
MDYITPKKLKQMVFAADMWVNENDWKHDYSLAVIEVAGSNYQISEFLTNIQIDS